MELPSALRPVAWSCYAVGVLLFLAPLGDLAAGIGSLNPGAVPWRFGAAGLLSGALVLPMAGVLLWCAGAALLGHRGLLRTLAVKAAVFAVVLLVLLVIFGLDALQVRPGVPDQARRVFDLAVLKAALAFTLEVVVLGVLAVNAHRAARAVGPRGARGGGTPLVVPSRGAP